jgi:hypothetical protein
MSDENNESNKNNKRIFAKLLLKGYLPFCVWMGKAARLRNHELTCQNQGQMMMTPLWT